MQQFKSFGFVFIFFSTLFSNALLANSTQTTNDCDLLLARTPVLHELIHAAQANQSELRADFPARTFVDPLVDQEIADPGLIAPQALSEMLPPKSSFKSQQAPNADAPSVIKLDKYDISIPLRHETRFKDSKVVTTIYATLPGKIVGARPHFIVGPEYKDTGVIFWGHGGGTPTAMGANGVNVGIESGKRGIPLLAPDGPGHADSSLLTVLSGLEAIEFDLQLMRETIAPEVPIVYMGHSWGGQKALQFYLNWHKLNTKGLNIVGLVALSPPADVSLGGSASDRQAADDRIEACMSQWLPNVAPSDVDFIENTVRNGKTSPVAGMVCTLTQLDYSWAAPSDNIPRPRLMTIVGENDGLVYTGREKAFEEFLRPLHKNPEDYLLLKAGRSHKGSNVPIGHNVFDRFLDAEGRAQLKDFLGDQASREDILETYTRMNHFVQQQVGKELPRLTINNTTNTPATILDRIYRLYANNLAFREFIKSYTYRSFERTNEHVRLQERSKILGQYVKPVQAALDKAESATTSEIEKRMTALSRKWKTSNLEMTKRELAIEHTPERIAELKAALDQALPIRQRIIDENPDSILQEQIMQLASRPADIDSYAQADAELKKQGLAKVRQKALEKFIAEYRQTQNDFRRKIGAQITAAISMEVRLPPGVSTLEDLKWEFGLDTSPERKAVLQKMIEEAQIIESERPALLQAKRNEAFESVELPEGVESSQAAFEEFQRIRSIIDVQYVPDGENKEKIQHLVSRIAETTEAISNASKELRAALNEVEAAKNSHKPALESFKKAVLRQMETDPHTKLQSLIQQREKALVFYVAADHDFQRHVAQRVIEAHEAGTLTSEFLQTLFNEVGEYVKRFYTGRANFLRASEEVNQGEIQFASNGALGDQAQEAAVALYGREGIEQKIRQKSNSRDNLLKIRANLQQELFALRKKYNELVPGYFDLREQDALSLLNRPYQDLVELLHVQNSDGTYVTTKDKNGNDKFAYDVFLIDTLRNLITEFEDMWRMRDIAEVGSALN